MTSLAYGPRGPGALGVSRRRTLRGGSLIAISIALLCAAPVESAWAAGEGAGEGQTKSVAAASPENRKAAGAAFAKGEKAFTGGKFGEAAAAFEEAFSFVPHPSALWNAARAWHKAGDLARAANLYDRYLKAAPDDAPDRKSAAKGLEQLAAKLGRFDIYAPGVQGLEIDERPVGDAASGERTNQSVYVNPGTHIVRGRLGARTLKRTQAVEPGGVASVALVADDATSESGDPKAGGSKVDPARPQAPKKDAGAEGAPFRPLPPVAVVIGGALTAVGLGVTIGSGIDTLNARSDFDAAPSTALLEEGQGKQTRTNVLIGVTAGVAALTSVAAIWFVRWGSPKGSAKIELGAGSMRASGSF